MRQHVPRSPFATRLSGSVKETELRIRNLFQGPKKRPPVPIMILTALLILSCGWLVSCQPREKVPPDSSSADSPDRSAEDQVPEDASTRPSGIDSPEFYALVHQYYRETYQGQTCYFGVDTPDVPQEGDLRLGPVAYAGSCRLDETTGAAYTVEVSQYFSGQWTDGYTDFLVLSRGADDSFQSVLGEANFNTDGMSAEDIIKQVAWKLLDLDVCLRRDGWPTPVGPGNWTNLFNYAYEGEPTVEVLEGWDPIYWPGDYWDRWSLEGITALRYYIAAEDRWSANTIDVTRSDLYTPRGIRVGSTRDEVLEAYPGIFDTPYWHDTNPDFPEGDYLWYCDSDEGWGAAILFFFDGDTVRQIRLTNMFN